MNNNAHVYALPAAISTVGIDRAKGLSSSLNSPPLLAHRAAWSQKRILVIVQRR